MADYRLIDLKKRIQVKKASEATDAGLQQHQQLKNVKVDENVFRTAFLKNCDVASPLIFIE